MQRLQAGQRGTSKEGLLPGIEEELLHSTTVSMHMLSMLHSVWMPASIRFCLDSILKGQKTASTVGTAPNGKHLYGKGNCYMIPTSCVFEWEIDQWYSLCPKTC